MCREVVVFPDYFRMNPGIHASSYACIVSKDMPSGHSAVSFLKSTNFYFIRFVHFYIMRSFTVVGEEFAFNAIVIKPVTSA